MGKMSEEKRKAKEAMAMNKTELTNFAGLALLADESKKEIARLKKKVADLEAEKQRSFRSGRRRDSVERLVEEIERQIDLEEKMLVKNQEIINRVEEELVEKAYLLTPREMFVIKKRYVQGMRWDEILNEILRCPEYDNFVFERSTFMRAHRSAIEKLCGAEREEGEK